MPNHKARSVIIIDPCQVARAYNYCLLDGLSKCGLDVVYAAGEFAHEQGQATPPGTRHFQVFFRVASLVQYLFDRRIVRRTIRSIEYPFDLIVLIGYILVRNIRVVHLMWSLFPQGDRYVCRLLQLLGRNVVYTAHNAFPHECNPRSVRNFAELYRTVDHLIVLTEATRREIQKECPELTDDRFSIIPHGDFGPLFETFPTNETLAGQIRKKAAGRKIVGFFGLIRPYKGLEYLIDAFPKIKQQMPNTFLLISGSMLIGDEKQLLDRINKIIAPDDAWIDIRFLPTPDLKAILSVMDVLVMPYLSASQSGNTVMAYSAGVPVVVTDVGGLAETVEQGETGFVVPPGDSKAVAEAVCHCVDDETHARLSRQVQEYPKENGLTWDAIARQTIAVYEQLAVPRSELNSRQHQAENVCPESPQ